MMVGRWCVQLAAVWHADIYHSIYITYKIKIYINLSIPF